MHSRIKILVMLWSLFLYRVRSMVSVRKQINQLLTSRKHIRLSEVDLEEKFVKGWGKGGQSVNKSNNAVYLKHFPSGIEIKCHESRILEENRKLARKRLLTKLDEQVNGSSSLSSIKSLRFKERKRQTEKKHRIRDNSKGHNMSDSK